MQECIVGVVCFQIALFFLFFLSLQTDTNWLNNYYPQLGKLQAKFQAILPATGLSNWKRAVFLISGYIQPHAKHMQQNVLFKSRLLFLGQNLELI